MLEIKRGIDKAEIISFDIFDTLLLRPYIDANDLFLDLEKIYKVPGFHQALSSAYRSFLQQYKNASDVTLDDTYSILHKKFAFFKAHRT